MVTLIKKFGARCGWWKLVYFWSWGGNAGWRIVRNINNKQPVIKYLSNLHPLPESGTGDPNKWGHVRHWEPYSGNKKK